MNGVNFKFPSYHVKMVKTLRIIVIMRSNILLFILFYFIFLSLYYFL